MVAKYVRVLEEREVNSNTDEVWTIYDVPKTWRAKTEKQILADGYEILKDGTVVKIEEVAE